MNVGALHAYLLRRHCEEQRDEAISNLAPSKTRLLRRVAPRNDMYVSANALTAECGQNPHVARRRVSFASQQRMAWEPLWYCLTALPLKYLVSS